MIEYFQNEPLAMISALTLIVGGIFVNNELRFYKLGKLLEELGGSSS